MDFAILARKISRLASDNSPTILTAIGVAGTVVTAYLTGRAAVTASRILDDYVPIHDRAFDTKKKAELIWKEFIPPVASACVTITCIIMANRAGSRKIAALAAAYSLSDKSFSEYKEKVVERLGKNKERAARDEIAQKQVDNQPPLLSAVPTGGSQLCYDSWSGRYFISDIESIRKAVNDVNYDINTYFAVAVNEFYDRIGIPRIEAGEEVGWNTDEMLDVYFSTTISIDQRPCIVLMFTSHPKPHYNRHV
jgi:hypothetical protein